MAAEAATNQKPQTKPRRSSSFSSNFNQSYQNNPHISKMAQVIDAGVANKSVSADFMKLVNVHHQMDNVDFEEIVKFLTEHLDDVIHDVHKLDKLYLDDGETMLNCPPAPEAKDSHGNELIRTLSEKQTSLGITIKREVKVHVLGPDPEDATKTKVEIREDMVKGGDDGKPVYSEHRRTISIARKA